MVDTAGTQFEGGVVGIDASVVQQHNSAPDTTEAPQPNINKESAIHPIDSVPALERVIRKRGGAPEHDRDRFIDAAADLESTLTRFDDIPDDVPPEHIAKMVRDRDPDLIFVKAFGRYVASAMAYYRDLHPVRDKNVGGEVTLFDFVMAKMLKMEIKYGDVPKIMEELGITSEAGFKEARKRYDERGGKPPEGFDEESFVAQHSVGELAPYTGSFENRTLRPLSGRLKQARDELEELRVELKDLPLPAQIEAVTTREEQATRGILERLSRANISAAEKADKVGVIRISGEMADILIATLGVADMFGTDAQGAVIAAIHDVIREDKALALAQLEPQAQEAIGNGEATANGQAVRAKIIGFRPMQGDKIATQSDGA